MSAQHVTGHDGQQQRPQQQNEGGPVRGMHNVQDMDQHSASGMDRRPNQRHRHKSNGCSPRRLGREYSQLSKSESRSDSDISDESNDSGQPGLGRRLISTRDRRRGPRRQRGTQGEAAEYYDQGQSFATNTAQQFHLQSPVRSRPTQDGSPHSRHYSTHGR